MERVIASGSPDNGDPRQHPRSGGMDHGTWSRASRTAWSLFVSLSSYLEAREQYLNAQEKCFTYAKSQRSKILMYECVMIIWQHE